MFRRPSVGVFGVCVVFFGLFAGGLPASGHSIPIDTSARCPSLTPDAGFTDIGGFDAPTRLAINCVAALGISKGTSPGTFAPSNPVTREQMALFLVRQAMVQGITVPAPVSQGFTDIVGLSAESQNAINQLAQLGITKGTTNTTFSPAQSVTRWQMALFLYRLSVVAGVAFTNDSAHNEFSDLGAVLPEAATAVNALADAHIALGTSESIFSPNLDVLRWQMALFLTRALPAPSGLILASTVARNFGASSPGILSPSDNIRITFSGVVTPTSTPVVMVITLLDSDGTTATLNCDINVVCLFVSEPGPAFRIQGLILSVSTDLTTTGGTIAGINPTAQIEAIAGLVSASGPPIDIAGSGTGRTFGGF